MSKSIKLWGIFASLFAMMVSAGCKKEFTAESEFNVQSLRSVATRPFKMSSETWYRISPIAPVPVPGFPGQLGFAYVPGGGTGNATHMGNVTTWFNQLGYSPDGQDPPAGAAPASLSIALTLPVLFPGAPLPLIQPNDFADLVTANAWLQLPASVNGLAVGSVVYNDKGDAVFCSSTTASVAVFESPTRINFSGQGIFAGGRGKFENATGTYHFSGFFNPQDANDAGYYMDGMITY